MLNDYAFLLAPSISNKNLKKRRSIVYIFQSVCSRFWQQAHLIIKKCIHAIEIPKLSSRAKPKYIERSH